ncbi:hypothetical protein [uncultured Phascolarctobacterium sp.]|uniref:hypothetical protein n=1 Tax=uncultured Phascolarctobacterium sp. TaxID=512296 RepID=UPI0027D95180|nr:hypothetical protein [uncultured Phascolarctobacterium sp.]
MLSQNTLVRHRKAIEKLYDSVCTVITSVEITDENGVTNFQDVMLYENQPCRISQSNVTAANNNYVVSEIDKVIDLYIAPELDIPAGSRIVATFNDIATEYKASGVPARYATYQKIRLEYVGRWA